MLFASLICICPWLCAFIVLTVTLTSQLGKAAVQQNVKAIKIEDKDCQVVDLAAGAGNTWCTCCSNLTVMLTSLLAKAAVEQSVKAILAKDKDCRVLDLAAGAGNTLCAFCMRLPCYKQLSSRPNHSTIILS